MKNSHVLHLLSDYKENKLPRDVHERVKSHLIFCLNCAQQFNELNRPKPQVAEKPSFSKSSVPRRRSTDVNMTLLRFVRMYWSIILVFIFLVSLVLYKNYQLKALQDKMLDQTTVVTAPISSVPVNTVLPKETPTMTPSHPPVAVRTTPPPAAAAIPAPTNFKEAHGPLSAIKDISELVITDAPSWEKVWARHTADMNPKDPCPTVDFSQNTVISIFAGEKPSSGYSIVISTVQKTEWNGKPARLVRYSVKSPSTNSMSAAVMTTPFIFQIIPKKEGTIFFKRSRT